MNMNPDTAPGSMLANPGVAQGIMEALRECDPEDFSDFIVVVEGMEVRCHRFLLSACSGFFRALLQSGMKESLERKATLHGISFDIFSTILKCLYKGISIVTEENIIDIWHASDLLQITFLWEECETFVVENLLQNSCAEVFKQARLLCSDKAVTAALGHMINNFASFIHSSSFLDLDFDGLLMLLKDDYLKRPSEDDFMNAISKWLAHPQEDNSETCLGASDFDGLKRLNNDYLKRASEDDVVNAILKWVAHPQEDNSKTCVGASAVGYEECDLYAKLDKADENGEVLTVSVLDGSKSQTKWQRNEYLGELLSARRISLVSRACIETLLKNDFVLNCDKALAIVQVNAVLYFKVAAFWPATVIHRAECSMENVFIFVHRRIVTIYNMNTFTFDFITKCPDGPVQERKFRNNQCFLQITDKKLHSLSKQFTGATSSKLRMRAKNILRASDLLVAHEDTLYVVGWHRLFKLACKSEGDLHAYLVPVCPLPVDMYGCSKRTCTTTRKNILILDESSAGEIVSVICYDTQTSRISQQHISGPVDRIISFKGERNTFLLQTDGTLHEIIEGEEGVEFKYLTKLWDFDWSLLGAIVYKTPLFLFGSTEPEHWASELPGYFDKIKLIAYV